MRTVLVCVKTAESAQRISAGASRMGLTQAVRTVLTADEVYQRVGAQPVDAVLADVCMVRPDPVKFTHRVMTLSPTTAVVLVGAVDPRTAAMAVAAGARGVIRGAADGEDLVVSLTQAIMMVCPQRTVRQVPRQRGASGLTQRELQVLRGMSQGKSNAEIGRDLFVSEDTVKTHARRLFRKLGARDRAHAVAEAFRGGIVS